MSEKKLDLKPDISLPGGISEPLKKQVEKALGFLPFTGDGKPFLALHIDSEKVKKGYVITRENADEIISITAANAASLVRGIYAFAEKFFGVRKFTYASAVKPSKMPVLPDKINEKYEPFFEYTETDWLSPHSTEYSFFNGLNGTRYRKLPDEYGGNAGYISSFAHTFTNEFCSAKKYFKSNPEYFALRGIKRFKSQLCLTNPDVYRIVRGEVFALLKKKHNPRAQLQIISLTQNDNLFYCTCENCRQADRKYRSHAGTVLEFVNRIADEVKAAGYNNVALDTFAYRYTRRPPEGITARENVIVRLCTIECCFSHPLSDENCTANAEFVKDLHGWSQICNRIYIWDYCTNFCNYTGIFPDFGTLQKNMQFYYENGVKGVYEEGNFHMEAECEFGELRAFLVSKLMQNPYCDYGALRDEFCRSYYGAGGEYICRFLDIITENAAQRHLSIYEPMTSTLTLDREQIEMCDSLWREAKSRTRLDEWEHVRASEISWRWWKYKNRVSEFASPFTLKKQADALRKDIAGLGVTRLSESGRVKAFFISAAHSHRTHAKTESVIKLMYKR
ncbi:MAG: DUF4838 domain-containing protein [Clostridia bacterium]|nr:DUF4838 domain-containing protein [Clostridia bacterium]